MQRLFTFSLGESGGSACYRDCCAVTTREHLYHKFRGSRCAAGGLDRGYEMRTRVQAWSPRFVSQAKETHTIDIETSHKRPDRYERK